jgi:2-hydroxychromene-2-carboxylate isomerase
MTTLQTEPVVVFTAAERNYIRGELDLVFSTLPTVAEGFQLKTWRGGPDAGKPKLSPIARGLVERGLMRLDTSRRLPLLFFTETGLAGLCAMMADRRLADPKKFAHVRRELGIDPADHGAAIGCAETRPEIT